MREKLLHVVLVALVVTACGSSEVARTVSDVGRPDDVRNGPDTTATADAATIDDAPAEIPAPVDASAPDDTVPGAIDATTPSEVPPSDPPPRDLSVAGPHRVAVWTGAVVGTQGSARVFYPMTIGPERYPLVTFAHGFQLAVGSYDRLLAHIASWGYVVASVSYPGTLLMVDHRAVPAAMSAARRAFADGGPAGFPAPSRVDVGRAVAMGHSLGGKGAIMAVLDDDAFVAALALDPVDDNPAPFGRVTEATPSIAPERMGSLRRPLGLFGATQSRCARFGQTCAPEASDYRRFAAAAPPGSTLAMWPLRDFGHMDFVDPGCGLACSACSGGAAPLDTRLAALRELSTVFLERFARGDASAQGAIDGARRDALTRAGVLWGGGASTLPACR